VTEPAGVEAEADPARRARSRGVAVRVAVRRLELSGITGPDGGQDTAHPGRGNPAAPEKGTFNISHSKC